MAAKETPPSDSHARNSATWSSGWTTGTQEFAGFVVCRLDAMMAGGLSHRDQEIVYEVRKQIFDEIGRRFPDFDLEEEAKRHA